MLLLLLLTLPTLSLPLLPPLCFRCFATLFRFRDAFAFHMLFHDIYATSLHAYDIVAITPYFDAAFAADVAAAIRLMIFSLPPS